MKRLIILLCALFPLFAQAERPARVTVLEGEDIVRNLVVASLREDIGANDTRLAQARIWMDQAAKTTGEDEKAIAAQCERTARWFFDVTRTKANALEMLEALAVLGRTGVPMQDTLRDYTAARRATPGRTHVEAFTTLVRK